MNEIVTPVWVKYAGDIFFLLIFLIVFLFFKPGKDDQETHLEDEEHEGPNPLEKMIVSEDESHLDTNADEHSKTAEGAGSSNSADKNS